MWEKSSSSKVRTHEICIEENQRGRKRRKEGYEWKQGFFFPMNWILLYQKEYGKYDEHHEKPMIYDSCATVEQIPLAGVHSKLCNGSPGASAIKRVSIQLFFLWKYRVLFCWRCFYDEDFICKKIIILFIQIQFTILTNCFYRIKWKMLLKNSIDERNSSNKAYVFFCGIKLRRVTWGVRKS